MYVKITASCKGGTFFETQCIYYGKTIAGCHATDKTYEFKRDILLNVLNVQIAT